MPTNFTAQPSTAPPTKPRPHGVHVAFDRDGAAVALFSSQKQALHYAADNNLRTALVPYGTPIAAVTRPVSSSGASVSTGNPPVGSSTGT